MSRVNLYVNISAIFLCLIGIGVVEVVSARIRGEDGTISLLIAVPLTKNNQALVDPGWFHLASALLAMDHFNTRNDSVVPELDPTSEMMRNCDIEFGLVKAVDTGTINHQAMEYMVQELQDNGPVDAIAGAYNEIPSLELSVLATGMQAPMVSHRAFDSNLLVPERHPYFSQVSADFQSRMQFVCKYLKHIGRANFVAVLYSSTASEIQQADMVATILEQDGFDQVQTFSYKTPRFNATSNEPAERSIRDAIERIQKSGFRTIYVLPSRLDTDCLLIGKAATEFGLDRGDHMWLMSGGVGDLSTEEMYTFMATGAVLAPFMHRAAYFYAVEDYNDVVAYESDFLRQDYDFLQRVEALNPIANYSQNWAHNVSSYQFPMYKIYSDSGGFNQGSAFMYDAVLSIGLGACQARFDNPRNDSALTGKMHLDGIRSVEFQGATGKVAFGGPNSPGSRVAETIPFTIINMLPQGENGPLFAQTEMYDPLADNWTEYTPFVYADGTGMPPARLRDEPEMNYLDPWIRIFGFVLMAIALLCVLLCTSWVYSYRSHVVVIAAQPILLYTLCFGSAMMVFVILLTSYDESYGWDEDMLSKACVGAVWMDVLGHIVSYSALFTKLWRVHRCMRNKSKTIKVWRVMWPCVLLVLTVVTILSAWTASGNYHWERQVTDEISGDSIGRCNGGNNVGYLTAIYLLHFIPTILAGIMAWKTSGVDDLYSESKWVLAFILVQTQVLLVGAPVVALLQDVNSNIRYICYALLTWTFPMSTMGLIMLPKIIIVRRMEKQANPPDSSADPALESAPVREAVESPTVATTARSLTEADTGEVTRSRRGPMIQIVTFD